MKKSNDIPIAAIRRLTLHDGPGTRTTVFVKGCPLHCRWCHNPECISATPQLLFHDNLRRLGKRGTPVEIRMPVVPGCNDGEGEFEAAARLLAEIPSLTAVRLLPYRSLARSKYRAAGMADTMPDAPTPDAAFLETRATILRRRLAVQVR